MAAPAYTWEFVCDLLGDRIPKLVTLKASANLETKVGTAVTVNAGKVDEAIDNVDSFLGLAAEETSAPLAEGDPIKVYLIAPGMVIKGKANADASALSGFNGKTIDLANGALDVADTVNGCFSVWRTEDAGLTVYCTVNAVKMAIQ